MMFIITKRKIIEIANGLLPFIVIERLLYRLELWTLSVRGSGGSFRDDDHVLR
jgi:hypothetical protein